MIKFMFPENFQWGTATASFQIEGAAYDGGKGLNIWDALCRKHPEDFEGGKSPDNGADFFYHYKQDIADMKELGLTSFRFSISWGRIFPENMDSVNHEGVTFYNNVIDTLLANGIEPFIDLYHWDLPQYIEDMGGLLNPEVIEQFCRYAETCFTHFGDRVKLWSTMNEPSVISFSSYETAGFPPFHANLQEALQVAHNLILMHYKAVRIYRQLHLKGKIGAVVAFVPMYPATGSPEDQAAATRQVDIVCNWWLMPFFEGKYPESILAYPQFSEVMPQDFAGALQENFIPVDFIGINYYNPGAIKNEAGTRLDSTSVENFYVQTDYGFRIYPQGLYDSLVYIKEKYNNPLVYVTENGIGLEDAGVEDRERGQFIQEHLRSISRASQRGVNVMGYYYWSHLDTFECRKAYKFKFGLNRVDLDSREKTRTRRGSWYYYQRIIKENAVC